MLSYNPYYANYIAHYGIKEHSGRYPFGSGARPFQSFSRGFRKPLPDATKKALAAVAVIGAAYAGYMLGFKVGTLIFNKPAKAAIKAAIAKYGKTMVNSLKKTSNTIKVTASTSVKMGKNKMSPKLKNTLKVAGIAGLGAYGVNKIANTSTKAERSLDKNTIYIGY